MASDQLSTLVKKMWKWRLEDSPLFATTVGVHTNNHEVERLSEEAFSNRDDQCKQFLADLQTISRNDLSKEDKLIYDMFQDMLQVVTDGYQWRHYSMFNQINFMQNVIIGFVPLIAATRFDSSDDFRMYIERLSKIPRFLDDQKILMRTSIKMGTQYHAVSVERALVDFEKVVAQSETPKETIFYKPFVAAVNKCEDASELRLACEKTIKDQVIPSLAGMLKFLLEEYILNARPAIGVSSLPNGLEFYKACLKWHLSVDMTPEDIHNIGLKEVDRIHSNMVKVQEEVGFKESFREFLAHLRSDPKFFHKTEQDLLDEYRSIIFEHIEPKLKNLFGKMPKNALVIQPMPYNGPGGQYFPASSDGTRPGTFYANLHEPSERARYSMVALALHEGCPGHHFQFSFAMEEDLPNFLKELDFVFETSAPFCFPYYTAFCEGWALYCEYLGEEMGVYRTPYELLGRYSDEISRACRLVIDTGIHAFGWSYEKAVNYMYEHTTDSLEMVNVEVARYITMPGQACGYKIGEMKFKELRKKAEDELGDLFDIKGFHQVVLQAGNITLPLLEEIVNGWIRNKLKS